MRVKIVHWVAKILGVLVKIDGAPYGASVHQRREPSLSQEAQS